MQWVYVLTASCGSDALSTVSGGISKAFQAHLVAIVITVEVTICVVSLGTKSAAIWEEETHYSYWHDIVYNKTLKVNELPSEFWDLAIVKYKYSTVALHIFSK